MPHTSYNLVGLIILAASQALSASSMSADNVNIEVVFDKDKGTGKGSVYNADVGTNNLSIPTDWLTSGAHIVSFRVQDSDGRWSTTITRTFLLIEGIGIDAAEYYIDHDPGKGMGTPVSASGTSAISFIVPTAGLAKGVHTLTFRIMTAGTWGESISKSFLVTSDSMIYEWFFDADPGIGKGHQEVASSGENIFMLPTGDLTPGAHLFSSRVRNTAGDWSHTVTHPVYVTEKIEGIVAAEYFVDNDPGIGKGNAVALDDAGNASFVVPTAGLETGTHTLIMRGQGESGTWHEIFSSPFEVTISVGIESVEWKNGFRAARDGGNVVVTPEDIPAGSVVQITGLDGNIHFRHTWKNVTGSLVVPIATPCRLIITVITPDGMRHSRIL